MARKKGEEKAIKANSVDIVKKALVDKKKER
jgi:hypothetical protein